MRWIAPVVAILATSCGGGGNGRGATPASLQAGGPHYAAHDPLEPVADRVAAEILADGDAAGVTIGVVRKTAAGTMFVKGYGLADVANKIPASRDTIYRIGPLTKQFTAAAILQLAEAKKLALDDDVLLYVPGVDTGGRIITLRHLLDNTSGIPSYTDTADFATWARTPHTPRQLVDHATKMLWEFEPGARFHDSNTGYVLLGMVIEKVSGQRYADYLRDHVFAPAHLTNTRYCDDLVSPERARGYAAKDDALVAADPLDLSTPFSAAALCSTVPDLLMWSQALAAGKVISAASYATMTTPPAAPAGDSYAMGLFVDRFERHRQLWHNGGINGFVSELHTFPDDGVTVVVLTNSDSDAAPRIARELSYAALGIASKSVIASPGELAAVAGTYQMPGIGATVVAVRHHHLMISPPGQDTARLEYLGGDTFAVGDPQVTLIFHRDPADNRITSVSVVLNGHSFDAMRAEGSGSGG